MGLPLFVQGAAEAGHFLDGYTVNDCDPIVGDEIRKVVTWKVQIFSCYNSFLKL